MDDQARAILDRDARELIDLASALVCIPSFKTEETAVALYLDRFFRERGYAVDLQEIEPGRLQTISRHARRRCSSCRTRPRRTPTSPLSNRRCWLRGAEMTFYPWKDTKEQIPLAVRHVRTFLKANRAA